MAESTLSSKNQIVIPKEAREALGVKSGDRVIILQRPKSYAAAIHGLAKTAYPKGYLDNERQSW